MITYRTTGDWGAGKGSNLTPEEVDGNFWDHEERIASIEDNPPTAISIQNFTIDGNLLTITLTDGSEHGPFVLPMAQWRWTGEWQEGITYFIGDIFTNSGNTYFVRVQHIAEAPFDPDRFTVDGNVYRLILSRAEQPYDIGMYYNDLILSGENTLMLHVANRTFTLPAMFVGSVGYLEVATTDSIISLPIFVNGSIVGTLAFTPGVDTTLEGGQFGTFATVDPDNGVAIVPTDRILIGQPYEEDSTARGLSVTIASLALVL